jgi:RNA polymerase sigma-70 factor (ECF subfamily)
MIGSRRSGHHLHMTSAASKPSPVRDLAPARLMSSPPYALPPSAPTDEREELTLEGLVRDHLDFIWRLLRRLGLSAADAEDAAQQVLLVAAAKLDSIEPGKERTFLYGIAIRIASNARRGQRRSLRTQRERSELEASELSPHGRVPWPDQLAELARAQALLDELLAQLPEELARCLFLAEIEQHSVPEMAELEGIPMGTAASRLRRARQEFRALLAREAHRNPLREEAP